MPFETKSRSGLLVLATMAAVFLAAGCSSMKMAVAEKFGYAKREQLVDHVQDARDAQQEARVQFASALEEFLAVTGVETGDLESVYDRLRNESERSEKKAGAVRDEIRDVERVADALFEEWQRELEQYSSPELRRASEQQLDKTRQRYDGLHSAMKRAESKMEPVLAAFRDQVLFLKHNLNARAIAALEQTAASLESEIATLIAEMDASIAEANAFIDAMASEEA